MENKYDELLIQGLTKLMDLEFSHFSKEEDLNYEFSNEYIKYKEKLIKNLGNSYWKFVNTVAKKVAVIIISLIIAFSSLLTVDAFREKVVDFIYKVYVSYTELLYKNNNQNMFIEKYYSSHYIPNNYSIVALNIDSVERMYVLWINKNGSYISLTQNVFSGSNQFNSEHGELSEIIVNNTPCLTCKTNTDYFCYWEFDGYRFELIYPIDLGEEFMSKVVGNLVEIDPKELEN